MSRVKIKLAFVAVALSTVCFTTAYAYKYNRWSSHHVVFEDEPGDARVNITRNACSIGGGNSAFAAGLNNYNHIQSLTPLFEAKFATQADACAMGYGNQLNEIGIEDYVFTSGYARTTYRYWNGELVEADVRLRPNHIDDGGGFRLPANASDNLDPSKDVYGTYLHELGHVLGFTHGGGTPNVMGSGIIPRLGDSRSAGTAEYGSVLPDEITGLEAGYTQQPGHEMIAVSPAYNLYDLISVLRPGSDGSADWENLAFLKEFENRGLPIGEYLTLEGGLNGTSLWKTKLGGPRFFRLFMTAFNPKLDVDDDGVILACPEDDIYLPYTVVNGGSSNLYDVDHGFYAVGESGKILENTYFLGRQTDVIPMVRSSSPDGSSKGGFTSGVMPVRVSFWADQNQVATVYHQVNLDGDIDDGRPFDERAKTQIRIRVQSHAENPRCPDVFVFDSTGELPEKEICVTPKVPAGCTDDSDCVGTGAENTYISDLFCKPIVDEVTDWVFETYKSAAYASSFEAKSCQCPPDLAPVNEL